MMAWEQLESAWPVHGSVLVREGLAWFMAGRSPYLDGGTRLCAVEVKSGKAVVDRRFDGLGPQEFCVAKPRKARTSAPVQPVQRAQFSASHKAAASSGSMPSMSTYIANWAMSRFVKFIF